MSPWLWPRTMTISEERLFSARSPSDRAGLISRDDPDREAIRSAMTNVSPRWTRARKNRGLGRGTQPPSSAVERVQALRDAVGPGVNLIRVDGSAFFFLPGTSDPQDKGSPRMTCRWQVLFPTAKRAEAISACGSSPSLSRGWLYRMHRVAGSQVHGQGFEPKTLNSEPSYREDSDITNGSKPRE